MLKSVDLYFLLVFLVVLINQTYNEVSSGKCTKVFPLIGSLKPPQVLVCRKHGFCTADLIQLRE